SVTGDRRSVIGGALLAVANLLLVSDGASQIGECFVSWQLPAALDRYLTVRRLPDRSPQSLHSCHPNLASAACISRRRAVSARDIGGHAFVTFSSSATDILLLPFAGPRTPGELTRGGCKSCFYYNGLRRSVETLFPPNVEDREFTSLVGMRKHSAQPREIQKL